MMGFLRNFTGPSFWIGWLVALALAGLLAWAAGGRGWSMAVAAAVAAVPPALLFLTWVVTRD